MESNGRFYLFSRIALTTALACSLTSCGNGSQQQAETQSPGPAQPTQPQGLTAQINSSPLFDSPKGWGAGFEKASGNGPGVVVGPGTNDPSRTLRQRFPAKPNDQFKIVARAASEGMPKASGRLQINWVGPENKFISASIKVINVTAEEQTFESDVVVAPAGVVAGVLFVTPHGTKDVVRYTEMRLLGQQ